MFITTPAEMIAMRFGTLWARKLRGSRATGWVTGPGAAEPSGVVAWTEAPSAVGAGLPSAEAGWGRRARSSSSRMRAGLSSWPSIFTYPPSGRIPIPYSVSPHLNLKSFNPPMSNPR